MTSPRDRLAARMGFTRPEVKPVSETTGKATGSIDQGPRGAQVAAPETGGDWLRRKAERSRQALYGD